MEDDFWTLERDYIYGNGELLAAETPMRLWFQGVKHTSNLKARKTTGSNSGDEEAERSALLNFLFLRRRIDQAIRAGAGNSHGLEKEVFVDLPKEISAIQRESIKINEAIADLMKLLE